MNANELRPVMVGVGVADAEADAYLRSRRKLVMRKRVLPAIGIVSLLALWWAIVAGFHVQPFIAPSPWLVVSTIFGKADLLLRNLLPTTIEALGGFMLGNLAAIAMATIFVHNKALQDALFPVVVMINSIPVVAKAPILVLIMGNGMEPKITIAGLVCFFPTLVNMVRGLESASPQTMELMRVLSASKTETFFKLRFYHSLPFLFSSLRISASMSVIGAVVGEWIGATTGIGALIIQATYNFDSALLYSAIVMSAVLSGSFFLAVTLIERWVIKWPAPTSH